MNKYIEWFVFSLVNVNKSASARKKVMEDKSMSSLVSEPKEHEFIITYFCFTLLLVRQINCLFC